MQLEEHEQLYSRWPKLYSQPKIHKPGAPIRFSTALQHTLVLDHYKVLHFYCKPLAKTSIRLKDSNDFKQPTQIPNVAASSIRSLISFCLDNTYFEFNGNISSLYSGGTIRSPLVVELAKIQITDVENTAMTT